MGKKVLVLGGAGYVGSLLASRLLQEGYEVTALDSLVHGGSSLLGLFGDERFTFVHGDIRDRTTVQSALAGCHALVILAAIVGDPACSREPSLARSVNVDATLQAIELSKTAGVERVVFASTCSNYGRMTDPTSYVTEESVLSPVSLYAETKVGVEKVMLGQERHKKPHFTVLRFATVFGLSPRMRFDLTVNEFTMEAMVKKKLTIYGEQFWRPYIHVTDAASAIVTVLKAPPEKISGEVFNVGDTDQNYQKRQLVDLIQQELTEKVEVQYVKKVEDPRDYRVSFAKVNRVLGFRIRRTVTDGIREVASAIRNRVITDFESPKYRN